MRTATYWCELAYVGDAIRSGVTIGVADGRITEVTSGQSAHSDATTLPGLTLPGFANVHSHAFHRALRGRVQTGERSFWAWRDRMYHAAAGLDPDRYHRLARAVFAEMALAGITSVGEFHYIHHQSDGTRYSNPNAMGEALLAAASEVGVRITLLDTLYLHGGLSTDGYMPLDGCQRRFGDRDVLAWAERVDGLSPGSAQRIGAAIHSVRAVDPTSLGVAADWAHTRRLPLHAHVSEQPAENEQCRQVHGASPVALLGDCGVLGDNFTAVHATHASADDLAALAAAKASVCLCPTTERDLGDGIAPSRELAASGIAICLGTDSHAVIDMFDETRSVELHERLASMRRSVHPTLSLIDMVTQAGHRSLGWDNAGCIRTGYRADLVTVALDSVRTVGAPVAAATDMALFAATGSDVTHVVIDGKVAVTDRVHRSIDVAAEMGASIAELMDG